MCAVRSKHNVHISPVGLDETDTEVLWYPLKSKNNPTNRMIELVIPAGIQLSDKLNLPETQHPASVNTGAQVEVLAVEEVFHKTLFWMRQIPCSSLLLAENPCQEAARMSSPLYGYRPRLLTGCRYTSVFKSSYM